MKTIILNYILILILILSLTSCEVKPAKIIYGDNHCYNCDMTVVDKTHVAEYVTNKGRSYPFDAIECLVMKINKEQNENQLKYILVADYLNPGKLIDVENATFLISEKIKSPMGANLSAFSSKKKALQTQTNFGGTLYNWEDLKVKLAQ